LAIVLCILSISLRLSAAQGQTSTANLACHLPQQELSPGDKVTISCDNLSKTSNFQLNIKGVNDQTGGKGTVLVPAVEGNNLVFRLPDDMVAGQYFVSVVSGTNQNESALVRGPLNVMGAPVVDAIYALTNYPAPRGFDFEIAGRNFKSSKEGNYIEIVDLRTLEACETQPPPADKTPCGNVEWKNSRRIFVTGFYPRHYYGPVKIRVHIGNSVSQETSVTFAPLTQQGVALVAALVFFAIAYLLFVLVRRGLTSDLVEGIRASPFTSLFLDRETNSYSLSKFQVVAWTAVTVYSYVYLFLCRTLIQGNFTFPDVSQNLPQLFFVSAGTTVAATAITANWGSKGAGSTQPSFADFISTGGLVAGDRFQFFTWTLVGCIGYVYLVIRMNPETPNISLPDIPQNFLYLMGVSSAGYLGGKLVRKPGPVIKTLSVAKITTPSASTVTSEQQLAALGGGPYAPSDKSIIVALPVLSLNLKGENLDPTGTVKVDDVVLRGDMYWISGQRDPQSGFCGDMTISFNHAAPYLEGKHYLTLANTDGQSVTVDFPIDPMSIDPIGPINADGQAQSLTFKGNNFVAGTTFEWRNPATSATATASGNATNISPKELTVNFAPGAAGAAKLTLISPLQLKASASITVKPA
jgi:hypothetical protein